MLVDPVTGERDMFSDRGAGAALTARDLARGLTSTRRWVHVSGYALFGEHGTAVMGAVRRSAEARGLGISVDPASSAELSRFGVERFLALVSGVDLLLPNLDEARLLTGAAAGDAGTAAAALLEVARTVVVTDGAAGAVSASTSRSPSTPTWTRKARTVSAVEVDRVVDTTGAGDAFAAGYLAALLDGSDAAGMPQPRQPRARLGRWARSVPSRPDPWAPACPPAQPAFCQSPSRLPSQSVK